MSLLISKDPDVFTYTKGNMPHVLITAEHAGWVVPVALNNLDTDIDFSAVHFGCDIGIDALADLMVQKGFSVLKHNYSRAVIDPLRPMEHPTLIAAQQDGILLPGNQNLTVKRRQQRIDEIYEVYHTKLRSLVDEMCADHPSVKPLVVSLHSMERALTVDSFGFPESGEERPEAAFLYYHDQEHIVGAKADHFRSKGVQTIGFNAPYCAVKHKTALFDRYANDVDLVVIERRNDLLRDPQMITHWANVVSEAIGKAIAVREQLASA